MASLAIGVLLLGFLPWGLVKPSADGVFMFLSGGINASGLLICGILAFVAGFIASAVSVPYGSQIGIIAAPAGLAVWSMRSAMLSKVFQAAPAAGERVKVYSSLKFEGFLWLAVIFCGFLGAVLADKVFRKRTVKLPDKMKPVLKLPEFLIIAIAVIGTVFVANFLVNIFAAGVSYSDPRLSHVTAQPLSLQLAFAVFIAFGACGFLAKIFLGSRPFWPAVASVVLIYYSATVYGKNSVLTYLNASWPANFFIRPAAAVLPVQMVAFGCLGAVWGYWLAVDYHLWRTHQS